MSPPSAYSSKADLVEMVALPNLMSEEKRDYTVREATEAGEHAVLEFRRGDAMNPQQWSNARRWIITLLLSIQTFTVSFGSAVYSGGSTEILREYRVTQEVMLLGIALYVLGFAVGPTLWAPLSEVYGRRPVFIVSFTAFTLCHLGGALCENIETLLVSRFLAGLFGASPLTNAAASIADMWRPEERAIPSFTFALTIFLGPTLSPLVGGFIAVGTGDFHGIFWVLFALSCFVLIVSAILVPETAAFAVLRHQARKLSKQSGRTYVSIDDVVPAGQQPKTLLRLLGNALKMPMVLLFTEPIVLFMSIWISIVYGELYLLFAAYPVVFRIHRGWNAGVAGLPFLAIAIGMVLATPLIVIGSRKYLVAIKAHNGHVPPEVRLAGPKLAAILMPIGILGWGWTANYESIHWIVPCILSVLFGLGFILVLLGGIVYLMDTYSPAYGASAVAANTILRSIIAFAFPEIAPKLFRAMSVGKAMTIVFAILVACSPVPFILEKYGPQIRARSKYASEMEARRRAALDKERSEEDSERSYSTV